MAPRRDCAPPAVVLAMEDLPDEPPTTPHSPLLPPDNLFPQQRATHDTEADPSPAPPDSSSAPIEETGRSRSNKGRCWRSRLVGRLLQKPLVLTGTLILGGVLGFVAFRGPACDCPSCPNKWMRSDDKCFFISRDTNDWKSSLEFCQTEGGGGTLLTVDEETQNELKSLHDLSGDYWVGLRKDAGSGEWRQLDGSVWTGPIESDAPQMNCSFVDSGKYRALDCSTSRRWICVKSLRGDG
ncbi:C-type lectin domain family 2 member B-like [Rhinoderma darwinii]|uniref:C-type lectin domain family 2 member B-like n=1 Tax=Rhinoderma darwinii TaxID=43563 RepID=UPI003F66B992